MVMTEPIEGLTEEIASLLQEQQDRLKEAAELIEDIDEIVKWSRLLCSKFPCPQEYIDKEIEKDAGRTLCFAINIEDINGKLVHEA